MDDTGSKYEALLIRDKEILYVGDRHGLDKLIDEETNIVDITGRVVFPSFCESHAHAPGLAYDILFNINLYPALSEEETLGMIREHIKEHPEKEIYYGRGFNMNLFSGDEAVIGPRKEKLDAICGDKPIIISDFGGNCMWMNTAALKKFNIFPEKECPPGGEIVVDKETGELWGIIRNSARTFIPYHVFTEEENYQAMKFFQDMLLKNGNTSVFALRPPGTVEPRTTLFEAFKVLEDRGELHLHVHGARDMDSESDIDRQIKDMLKVKERVESDKIKFTTAKFFIDGVIEGLDGFLLEPYSEEIGKGDSFTSKMFWDKDVLAYAFQKSMEAGFQIHCHTIGDGAVRGTLDALETALSKVPEADYRNALTHLQLVHEEDIRRMADMGVATAVQSYWHFKNPTAFPIELKCLGEERAESEYPLKKLVAAGILVVNSSDYPVTPNPNPFIAIEAAVTRNLVIADDLEIDDIKDMEDPEYLLGKEERISVDDAIRSFTVNAAVNRFEEDRLGMLKPGMLADFIIVDLDPYEINPVDLEKITVLATYFEGEEVYNKN